MTLLEQVLANTAPRHNGHAHRIGKVRARPKAPIVTPSPAGLPADYAEIERQLFIVQDEPRSVGDRVFHGFTWRRMFGALGESLLRFGIGFLLLTGIAVWAAIALARLA